MPAAGEETLRLVPLGLSFRTRAGGTASAPERVLVAAPDLSARAVVTGPVLTLPERSLWVHARRDPAQGAGYLLRREVRAGDAAVLVDPEEATVYTFAGRPAWPLTPTLTSLDALPYTMRFTVKRTAQLRISGMAGTALALRVGGSAAHAFYARPFRLDGQPRRFDARPPLQLSVGRRWNTNHFYKRQRGSLSLRFFLREANGLILKGNARNPYRLQWSLWRGETECARGEARRDYRVRIPASRARAAQGALRVRVVLEGLGDARQLELTPHRQTREVRVGSVRTRVFPELAANARQYAAWTQRLLRAYWDTNRGGPATMRLSWWTHMAPGILGAGMRGHLFLNEGKLVGFTATHNWDGNVLHEMAHGFGYGHGRAMNAAMGRARRRYQQLKPGPKRVPAGARYAGVFQAIAAGAARVEAARDETGEPDPQAGEEDGAPRDPWAEAAAPLSDAFLAYYFRRAYGRQRDARRRAWSAAWTWWLVLRDFSGPEAEAAALSRAAGEPLAWLVRLRGGTVRDRRLEAALGELDAAVGQLVKQRARERTRRRWRGRDYQGEPDLGRLVASARAELGDRRARVQVLLELAREHQARGDEEATQDTLVTALLEARRDWPLLEAETLAAAAAEWPRAPGSVRQLLKELKAAIAAQDQPALRRLLPAAARLGTRRVLDPLFAALELLAADGRTYRVARAELGQLTGRQGWKRVHQLLKRRSSPAPGVFAIELLERRDRSEDDAVLLDALGHKQSAVRRRAIVALGSRRRVAVVRALVAHMTHLDDDPAAEHQQVAGALERLLGARLQRGEDYAAWWDGTFPADLADPPAPAEAPPAAGDDDPAGDLVETPPPADDDREEAAPPPPREGQLATYYSEPLVGKGIVFLFDFSSSMRKSKLLAGAQAELERAIRALPAGASFNVVTFARRSYAWEPALRPASDAHKEAACAFVADIGKGDNQTRLDLAFQRAFAYEGIDTLVVLTDGYPYKGKKRIPAPTILDLVDRRNLALQARIVTFGFAEANHELLQALAQRTGGTYQRLE